MQEYWHWSRSSVIRYNLAKAHRATSSSEWNWRASLYLWIAASQFLCNTECSAIWWQMFAASCLCSNTASGCSTWTLFNILLLSSLASPRVWMEESMLLFFSYTLARRVWSFAYISMSDIISRNIENLIKIYTMTGSNIYQLSPTLWQEPLDQRRIY